MELTTEYLKQKGFKQLEGANIWLYKIVESVKENLSITAYHDGMNDTFKISLDIAKDGEIYEHEDGSFPLRSIKTVEELETIFSFLPKQESKLKPLFEALNPILTLDEEKMEVVEWKWTPKEWEDCYYLGIEFRIVKESYCKIKHKAQLKTNILFQTEHQAKDFQTYCKNYLKK